MSTIKPVVISSPSFDGSFQPASTVASASDQTQTTDRRDPWFPDDDEVREITSQAYALSEAAYPKNEGQAYFEDLLIRSTIGICRNKYQNG